MARMIPRDGQSPSATSRWRRPASATIGGLVALVVLAIGYPIVSTSLDHPLTVFALPALLVAVVAGPRSIASMGALSVGVAGIEGALDDHFSVTGLIARLLVVVAAIVCALASSRLRSARQAEFRSLATDTEVLRERLGALAKTLHAGPMGAWRWDRASGVVTWDANLERLFGLAPGTFGGTIDHWIAHVPEERRDAARAEFEGALASARSVTFEQDCVWPDGSLHWLKGIGEPTFDAQGELSGAVGIAVGVDEVHAEDQAHERQLQRERRNRERADFLNRTMNAIGSSLEVDELVDNITAAVVPDLADWCRLTLLINDGGATSTTVTTVHSDPDLSLALRSMEQVHPLDLDSDRSSAMVIRSGETVFNPVVDDTMLAARIVDEAQRKLVARLDVRSVIIVALKGPLGVLGALQLFRTSRATSYDDDDVALAEEIAVTIGFALTNALHFDRQRSARRALDILQRLTGRLAVAVTVEDVVREVIVHGTSGLGADAGLLYLLDANERLTLAGQTGYDPKAMQAWSSIELGDQVPIADAVQRNRPVVLRNTVEIAEQYPRFAANTGSDKAVVAFPLQIRRVRTGGIQFSFGEAHDFTQDELTMLETLAGRCAGALERAELYERQREASLTLQRRMLPELPVLPPQLVAAAHYQPATGGEVGGDWYQLFAVNGGCWSAVLGDAVGRGIPAAAAMGQLRGVITGAASVDPEPARVIAASDAFAALGTDTRAASLAYALIDLGRGEIRYASAGHLPTLLLHQDGSVVLLTEGRGTLLGVRSDPDAIVPGRTPFGPGDTLVMYSDGLIERRAETIDEGLARIQQSVAILGSAEPAELCTKLVHALVGEGPIDDDVAVLIVRRLG
jgi:GAF domain-containing protein/PAS domain-containing protein